MPDLLHMTEGEFDSWLCAQCPLLYMYRHAPATETCLCWGFCIEPGWRQILAEASLKLEEYIKTQPIIMKFRASQVKQKLGRLCLYLESYDSVTQKIIWEAEDQSIRTCEYCGKPGERRFGDWIRVQCNECWDKARRLQHGR